jgi:hypothetical protein
MSKSKITTPKALFAKDLAHWEASAMTVALLNQAAPDIVYKTFLTSLVRIL